MAGPKVYVSGGGQKYHANGVCSGLVDGQAKARREGRGTREVIESDLSEVGEDREPCTVCWPHSPGWNDWSNLEHRVIRLGDSDYEIDFFTNVLRKIPGLRAGDVHVQEQFTYGRHLGRIDFAVLKDGVRLAIEVDGLRKSPTGQPVDHKAQSRLTQRQNELGEQGWRVVRFTNTDVRMNPDRCRQAVERSLTNIGRPETRIAAAAPSPTSAPAQAQHWGSAPRPAETGANPPREQPTNTKTTTKDDATKGRWPRIGVAVAAVVGCAIVVVIAVGAGDKPRSGAPVGPTCPAELPVKGNESQSDDLIYHEPGWRYYDDTRPERCFADATAAEDDGFRASEAR